jgi:hypothetical protein
MTILNRLEEINAERRRRGQRPLERHEAERHVRDAGHDDHTLLYASLVGLAVAASAASEASATPIAAAETTAPQPTFVSGGGEMGSGAGASADYGSTNVDVGGAGGGPTGTDI